MMDLIMSMLERVFFVQIYNENICDLFNKENIDFRSQKNSDKHVVFENSNGEIAVTNITTRFVTTAQEVR